MGGPNNKFMESINVQRLYIRSRGDVQERQRAKDVKRLAEKQVDPAKIKEKPQALLSLSLGLLKYCLRSEISVSALSRYMCRYICI
jgi:hypothetical protein